MKRERKVLVRVRFVLILLLYVWGEFDKRDKYLLRILRKSSVYPKVTGSWKRRPNKFQKTREMMQEMPSMSPVSFAKQHSGLSTSILNPQILPHLSNIRFIKAASDTF